MVPSILPLISESDFPEFQQKISDLVHITFEEWQDGHARAIAYRRLRNGSTEIAVCPKEFNAWLRRHGTTAHMELLWVFAEEKAAELVRSSVSLPH